MQRSAEAPGQVALGGANRGRLDPRGPLSAFLLHTLYQSPRPLPTLGAHARQAARASAYSLSNEDAQLSLTLLYELHYRGLPGVDDRWEWQPDLVAAAGELEAVLLRDLHALVAPKLPTVAAGSDVPQVLGALVRDDRSPSLSKYLARRGTREQYAEYLIHRSIYHLREADPHTFAIPRIGGGPKAALVEIQADEYGGGRPEWVHATLFGNSMRGMGLDASYGRYLGEVPAITHAWSNTMTLFGLHRRWRGAAVGHLAALEMTSSLPMRRYGNGLRRLGYDDGTTRFFDEHIEADAVHEQIAAHDLAGGLARAEPEIANDIVFGAAAALAMDGQLAAHLLDSWTAGRTSLRTPDPWPQLLATQEPE